jgi:hypothetical protein
MTTPVLSLEILQTPGLVQLQAAVLPTPSVVAVLRYANVTTHLTDRLATGQKDFRFP